LKSAKKTIKTKKQNTPVEKENKEFNNPKARHKTSQKQ